MGTCASIYLIKIVKPFRLIEHRNCPIVNRIKRFLLALLTGPASNTSETGSSRRETELKHGVPSEEAAIREERGQHEEEVTSILSSIRRIAAEFSAARARHHTERTIRSLPVELQKDIGWPDAFDRDTGYRREGVWAGTK